MLAMFVAHGYDAWVVPAAKVGVGYRITREIAAVAIPSFFLLAGVGIALRWLRAPGAEHAALRKDLALRALRLIAGGYALSLAYAALDGGLGQPEVWLRSDILHAIGASMLVVVLLLFAVRTDGAVQAGAIAAGPARERLCSAAIVLAFAIVTLWPLLPPVPSIASSPLGYVLAPFLPVDGITRFAALPLAAFCCIGLRFALRPDFAAPPRAYWTGLLVLAAACALLVSPTGQAWIGATPSAHAALRFNAVGGIARALAVLLLACLLPPRSLAPCALLGRHSLLLYAAHIPFCYGRFGKPLRSRLDLAQASLALATLTAAALLMVAALEAYSNRRAGQRSAR